MIKLIKKLLTKFFGGNMKFEIFKDKAGEWRFNLLANNWKVVCSSEGYTSKRNALNGIRCIAKGAKKAKIIERAE